MTTPPAKSYYEVALTNRQVLAVFVVLLLAVMAAFVGGVWVGRRGPLAAVQTAGGTAIEAAEIEAGEEPLERFDFFSRGAAGQEMEEVEPEAEVGEIDAGEPEVGAPPSDPVETVPPPDPPEPVEEEKPEEPQVAETVEPEPETETEPEPEPAAPEPEPAAPAPAAPAGSLVVQVFSSSNQVQAQSVVDQLRSGGYPALLSPVEVSGRTMYRVRIGPYADRSAAERIAEAVRRDYRLETWITQ